MHEDMDFCDATSLFICAHCSYASSCTTDIPQVARLSSVIACCALWRRRSMETRVWYEDTHATLKYELQISRLSENNSMYDFCRLGFRLPLVDFLTNG